jgi:hypothetical protein
MLIAPTGTATEALPHMHALLNVRPDGFDNIEAAVEWQYVLFSCLLQLLFCFWGRLLPGPGGACTPINDLHTISGWMVDIFVTTVRGVSCSFS